MREMCSFLSLSPDQGKVSKCEVKFCPLEQILKSKKKNKLKNTGIPSQYLFMENITKSMKLAFQMSATLIVVMQN